MKTILTSILMLITVISFAQDPPEKYNKVWDNIGIGDTDKAKKDLSKILKTNPKDPWPYWLMGICITPSWNNPEANTYFEQAIAIDSSFAPAYSSLASRIDHDSINYQRAEKLYTKAIELAPKDNHNYVARGDLYLRQKKYDLAIRDSETAKSIEPGDCYFANQIIIRSLHDQGRMDELKQFLLSNDPNNGGGPPDGEYQFFLGGLYEGWGEPEKACAFYQQAVEDTEFMLDIVDPGVLDEELAQYRAKVKAICK